MKNVLFTALIYILICPFIHGQDNEIDTKINSIKEYLQNGGDLNKQEEYGSYYYQDFIWDFGFHCDTTELPIVEFLIEQDQKLQEPFFFTGDPCLEMRNYIFYYVQLLEEDGHDIKRKTLKNLIDIYFLPDGYSEESYINHFDFYDKTALMYACEMQNKKLIKYLLSNDANPQLKNKKGQKASDFYENEEFKKLLK
jgi:hypothetical protein